MSRLETLRSYRPEEMIVFDTETTGVRTNGEDEILSLAIIDGSGNVLFNSLVKPEHRVRWPKAQEVNGISPDMVKDKPSLLDHKGEVEKIFNNAKLYVAYNAYFDLGMLRAGGITIPKHPVFDVMDEFAKVHGEWNAYHKDWNWFKLGDCAAYYDVPTPNAHDALADAQTTLQCYRGLLDDPWFDEPRHRPRVVPDEEAWYEGELDYGDEWDRVYIVHRHVDPPSYVQTSAKPEPEPEPEPEESIAEPKPARSVSQPRKSRPALAVIGGTCCVIGALLLFGGAVAFGFVLVVLGVVTVATSRGSK